MLLLLQKDADAVTHMIMMMTIGSWIEEVRERETASSTDAASACEVVLDEAYVSMCMRIPSFVVVAVCPPNSEYVSVFDV